MKWVGLIQTSASSGFQQFSLAVNPHLCHLDLEKATKTTQQGVIHLNKSRSLTCLISSPAGI